MDFLRLAAGVAAEQSLGQGREGERSDMWAYRAEEGPFYKPGKVMRIHCRPPAIEKKHFDAAVRAFSHEG